MENILSSTFVFKFIKFGVVGVSGMAVDFGFTYLCKEIFKVHKYVSNAIGFTLAAISNYYLNRIWTFNSHNPHVLNEFTHFFLISTIGLIINSLILWIMVSKFNRNFYFSKLIAIGVTVIWNFFINYLFTFH